MNGDYQEKIDECKEQLSLIETKIDEDKFSSYVPYLIAYAVVKCCGTIEIIYKSLVFDHLVTGVNQETSNFLEKTLKDTSSNPSTGNIQKILDTINSSWSSEFQNQIKVGDAKGCLNSLVQLRNDFSHGKSITATIGDVKRYFDGAINVLNIIDSIIK